MPARYTDIQTNRHRADSQRQTDSQSYKHTVRDRNEDRERQTYLPKVSSLGSNRRLEGEALWKHLKKVEFVVCTMKFGIEADIDKRTGTGTGQTDRKTDRHIYIYITECPVKYVPLSLSNSQEDLKRK